MSHLVNVIQRKATSNRTSDQKIHIELKYLLLNFIKFHSRIKQIKTEQVFICKNI